MHQSYSLVLLNTGSELANQSTELRLRNVESDVSFINDSSSDDEGVDNSYDSNDEQAIDEKVYEWLKKYVGLLQP